MSETETIYDILIASPNQGFWTQMFELLKGYSPYRLFHGSNLDRVMEPPADNFKPVLALVEGVKGTQGTSEWVQAIRMTYTQTPIVVLYTKDCPIEFASLSKNGANYLMHMPYDDEFLTDIILKLAPVDLQGESIPITALLPVAIDDFEPETEINFDLYVHLPANKKTLAFRKSGSNIDDKAIQKIKKSAQRVYVKKTHLKKFYEYATAMLSMRNSTDNICHTEKSQKAKANIQQFMANFLDADTGNFEFGKNILDKCKQIVADLSIMKDLSDQEICLAIKNFTGSNRTNYNDAINMCAYCGFFARLLAEPNEFVESAAIAGILHNIGLADLPVSTSGKKPDQYTPDEKKLFINYPVKGVVMIKSKKVPLSQEISRAINEHRELCDKSGFPNKASGGEVTRLAKLLAIAFRFNEMTSLVDDQVAYTPLNAIEKMKEESFQGTPKFDVTMLNKVANKLIAGLKQ